MVVQVFHIRSAKHGVSQAEDLALQREIGAGMDYPGLFLRISSAFLGNWFHKSVTTLWREWLIVFCKLVWSVHSYSIHLLKRRLLDTHYPASARSWWCPAEVAMVMRESWRDLIWNDRNGWICTERDITERKTLSDLTLVVKMAAIGDSTLISDFVVVLRRICFAIYQNVMYLRKY